MIKTLRIPYLLAANVLTIKEISEKGYSLSRQLRAVDLYLCLKAESHKIHDVDKQIDYLCRLCKCSKNTFWTRLKEAENLGLLIIDAYTSFGSKSIYDINLKSYDVLINLYGAYKTKWHTVPYDLEKPQQTVGYILKALEIKENQERQNFAMRRKLPAHPIQAAFEAYLQKTGYNLQFNLQNITGLQLHTFAVGTDRSIYDHLHDFNALQDRNIVKIAEAHGLKSWQAAAYMKNQLLQRGLIFIERPEPTVCQYKSTKKKPEIKKGSRAVKGRYYFRSTKTAVLTLPDHIILNPDVFSTPWPESKKPEISTSKTAPRAA